MALLLYLKWRVNPAGRMVVIASKVVRDAHTRVFSYIKEIHLAAPKSAEYDIQIKDTNDEKGIFHKLEGEDGQTLLNYRGCIVSLPIKVNAINDEMGANLLGKHPDDCLIIAFDEAQELPGKLLESRIFANWYTNENHEVFAWGNPMPVDMTAPETHDVLFKMGSKGLSISNLKEKEKNAYKTSYWVFGSTAVLHLAMTDSPKDDPDEAQYFLDRGDGIMQQRLHFLAGKSSVESIANGIPKDSPSWYSQVLGFPYIHSAHSKNPSVVTPFMVREAARYPLIWLKPVWDYYMGVDPASSGKNDEASIVVLRAGTMQDGRHGVDAMGGQHCRRVSFIEEEEFSDTIIETMWGLAQSLNIPLRNIAIETHGVGDVFRYALNRHIEQGKWERDANLGQKAHIVSPMIKPTDRMLFKMLGHTKPAEEIVANVITEYWVAVRCMVLSRQLFNVPDFILQQFYNRYMVNQSGAMKYKVETKDDMKKRGINSPNDADALCNAIDLIRNRGFKYRYKDTGVYKEEFGAEYQNRKKLKEIDTNMGMIADILGVGDNLRKFKQNERRIMLENKTIRKKKDSSFVNMRYLNSDGKESYGSGPQTSGDGAFGLGDMRRKKAKSIKSKNDIDVL
ncbi:MAG: hypothetical protein E4H07_08640 [Nitrosomonadales bacterium]|nr:MAG: hypothetical protein E4H07_08640 [Nitrosomonadales bacterium]